MSKAKAFSKPNMPLTPPIFYILLSLSVRERHGYEIMKQVREDSNNKISLGPGTLYSAIKRMLDAGLIVELDERPILSDDERRKYYKITEKGRELLATELTRFADALSLARKKKIFPNSIKNISLAI